MTLDEVLDQDFRVGSRFLAHPDLAEGIRAMIIDKDRRPTVAGDPGPGLRQPSVDGFFAAARVAG